MTAVKLRGETARTPFTTGTLELAFTHVFQPEFVVENANVFPVGSRSPKEDFLAKILCEAVAALTRTPCKPLIPITDAGNPGVSAEESESGDEVPPSLPLPALSKEEVWHLQVFYKRLYERFYEAKKAHFHNAQGKCFVRELLEFLLPKDFACRLSTSPNGDFQPGSFEITWIVEPHLDRRAANSSQAYTQPRVADVVAYHRGKEFFAFVVEVKSYSDKDTTEAQLQEQMVGLFHPQQQVMLGLSVHPQKVSPRLLKRSSSGFVKSNLADLDYTESGLQTLVALVLAVSRNTLDYC